MATYVNNLRLKEITTGDEDGTWGTSTNTNLELITDGFSYGTKEMAADANETFTMPDATADDTRSFYLKITSAVSLTATREVTLGPNTVSKVWMIENATSGSQIITIKQGSGATVNVPNGSKVMIVTDGAGAGAAVFNANPTEVGGTVTSVGGTGTVNGLTLTGTVTTSGNLTLGGTLANVDLTSQVTGTLPIANGGTGSTSTTYVDLTTNVTGTLPVANGGTGVTTSTGSGSVVLSTAPTLEGTVTLNQTNIYTNTSAEINNTIADKGTFLNFTQSRSGGASNANFVIGHGGNSSGDVEFKNTTSSHIKFYVADVERVRLYAGGALIASSGVTLGTAVDTYNADNTLDDYEEGTFTPEVADASASGNTASVSTINGWYTKVGRQVTVYVALININTTGMTAGNFLYIRNLPFTALNTTSGNSIGSVEVDNIDFTGYVTAAIGLNQSYLLLKDNIDSSGDAVLTVASVLSSLSDIKVTITYNV
jgi:hypothetical protein